jgi:excisionase family DNA binding protein
MLGMGVAGEGATGMAERDEQARGNGPPHAEGQHDGDWAERLLRTSEVAELFSVSSRTVREWARRGLLPTIRTPGGQHRFPEHPVRELLHRVRGLADDLDRPRADSR